jgi:hypothetical protein
MEIMTSGFKHENKYYTYSRRPWKTKINCEIIKGFTIYPFKKSWSAS